MAQTLTSTRPRGNAISRTVSSVMSVGTPDAFLGHAIQTELDGNTARPKASMRPLNALRLVAVS